MEKIKNKKILCFSGGIDSTIAFHKLGSPETMYVMLNHRYQEKELHCINELKKIIPQLRTALFPGPNLGMFEEGEHAYISKRNFHLALIASHFGNHIYVVGNKEDIHHDNNRTAYDVMAYAMNQTQHPQEPKITIKSPFWDWSKEEIVKWFVDNYPRDYVEKVLKTSKSCYDANTMGQCGKCISCKRKYDAVKPYFEDSWKWFERDIRKWKGLKNE